jgi:hypothetical protein
MARYIDADALLKSIDEFIYMNESTKSLYKTIVRKQPTAFDLDKVVQELYKRFTECYNNKSLGALSVAYDEAIDIVRNGGKE